MSWQATEWVRVTRVGDSKLKLLLLMLCNYANEDGESWYSQEQIAFDTEIPVRTLRRKLEELQEQGFIEVIHRTAESGLKKNSLIRILMGPAANLAGGEHQRPKTASTTGQKEGDPSANKVAGVNLNHSNHKKHTARAKDEAYSEDFENLWQQYPRTRNTSKKDAWNFYRMMTDEKREIARRAVPLFAAAMRAEARPEDKIMHMIRFLRGGVYETVAAPAVAAVATKDNVDWHKTATREQWKVVLERWAATNDWRTVWGPSPGKPGCSVPIDLVAAHNLKHRASMFSAEELAEFQRIVDQSRRPPEAA